MPQLFANNAGSYLESVLGGTVNDRYVFVNQSEGLAFPEILNTIDYFVVTLENVETKEYEIVRVTSFDRSLGKMTCTRAQEGTTVRSFPIGSKVQLRVTKETLERLRSSASDIASYVHNQQTASSLWVVSHNLGRRPAVVIEEGTWAGSVFTKTSEIDGDVSYTDSLGADSVNQLRISFSGVFPQGGGVIGRVLCT